MCHGWQFFSPWGATLGLAGMGLILGYGIYRRAQNRPLEWSLSLQNAEIRVTLSSSRPCCASPMSFGQQAMAYAQRRSRED